MFFLLRMAFWLGLVLVLLPTGKTPDANKGPKVDPVEAVTAAGAAAADMAQFCNRQPQACEVGGQLAGVVGARVQNGARKAYGFFTDKLEGQDKAEPKAEKIGEKNVDKATPEAEPAKKPASKRVLDRKNPDHTGSIGGDDDTPEFRQHNTLTQDDLNIEWQAPM
ncbi:MAG: hypothetical protein EKK40_15385 [Bradyrhizobiaceae bacterium]|nr:MAG: hypothetical protein EKK40_15385 [Bradyrhizobiaceae bacterium]